MREYPTMTWTQGEEDQTAQYGVATCATALDEDAIAAATDASLAAGATPEVLVEVLLLTSGVGFHGLHEGILALRAAVPPRDRGPDELRSRREGSSTYWQRFEAELRGFLDGLARWSPVGYEAFFEFCAAPIRHGTFTARQRELLWLAVDATPTHRYLPGLRLHVTNAVVFGATRQQIRETIDIAARAPTHTGISAHRAAG
jgi:alkylhydroperoxidase/carboxymuconolactone decarboxylase family protein YurZ